MSAAAARFTIERELGRGGMGVVYLARDRERGGELVALKRLNAAIDPASLKREFESARRLRHPVIVAVRELGRDELGSFLVMEYVEGDDLAQLSGSLTPERVTGYALDLADALEYARRRGYVHGDLKPQNLRVPRADPSHVRILDLGLARLVGAQPSGGTPAYLAPEVLRGKPADARADLFALGCVLYEALSGQPPFRGIDRVSPPPPLPETVPPALSDVIGRLLRHRPEDRPGRAADLVVLLGMALPRRLPLPEGDLVGRDEVLARVRPGLRLVIEAAEGMGVTRVLREIAERGEVEDLEVVCRDVDAAGNELDAGAAAAVIAACRPGGRPQLAGFERVRLLPLTAAEVHALADSRLPLEPGASRAVGRWAYREAGGSPAGVVEALEGLRGSGLLRPGPLGLEVDPDQLEEFVPPVPPRTARRVAALAPAVVREVARWLVLGEGDRPALLGEAELVTPAGGAGAEAVCGSLRRALLEALAPEEGCQLHAAAAAALLARPDPDARAVARHLLAAGRTIEAAGWLRPAAEAARAAGERREARRFLLLGVEQLAPGPERALCRFELAREQALTGDHPAALSSLAAAREEDPNLAIATYLAEAEVHAGCKQNPEARSAAVEVIRRTRGAGGESDRAKALFVLGRVAAQRARYDTARRYFDAALDLHRRLGEASDVARSANALGNVDYLAKRYDEALVAYERGLDAARAAGDQRLSGVALQNLGRIYVEHRRQSERARPSIAAGVAAAEAEGDRPRLARALVLLAVLDLDQGRPDDARRHLERAITAQREVGDAVGAAYASVRLGEVLTCLGRFADAKVLLDGALEVALRNQEDRLAAGSLDYLGRWALEVSDPELAKSYLERALTLIGCTGGATREASIRASLAIALARLGRGEAAQSVAADTPEEGLEDREVAAQVARAGATLLEAEGRGNEAAAALRRTTSTLREAGCELELARTLLDLGGVLGRLGHTGEAVQALEEARKLSDERGAKPLLARVLLAKARVKSEGW